MLVLGKGICLGKFHRDQFIYRVVTPSGGEKDQGIPMNLPMNPHSNT